jgi:predicted nuclease of predicted toxin-antitoxin system
MPPASDSPPWRFLVDENLPARLVGYLRSEGYEAEHAYDVGLRTRPDADVFAYARTAGATLITQDHDLERDTGQFPPPHPGVVLIELPQGWPREQKMQRILAALRSLAGQPLQNTLVIVEPSQALVRRQ